MTKHKPNYLFPPEMFDSIGRVGFNDYIISYIDSMLWLINRKDVKIFNSNLELKIECEQSYSFRAIRKAHNNDIIAATLSDLLRLENPCEKDTIEVIKKPTGITQHYITLTLIKDVLHSIILH